MSAVRRLTWVVGALAMVSAVAAAGGAYALAQYSWDQVVSYRTPYGDYERPWVSDALRRRAPDSAEQTSTPAPRVVLVLVDGLTLRSSLEEMSTLDTLRQYGADLVAVTPQPSLSYPTWTNVLSGATPAISGVTTNWFEDAVPVETILDSAVRAGLRVAVSGPKDFEMLYLADYLEVTPPRVDAYLQPWEDGGYMATAYVDEAIRLARTKDPQLLLVHLPDTDVAAHDYGADSEQYREVVRRIDRDIARLVENLQDDHTTFVITADHGHVDPGGHGGWEPEVTRVPLVLVGWGIASLADETVSQSAIAPTVAGLLGIDIPRHAEGAVIAQALTDADASARASLRQHRAFAQSYLSVVATDAPRIDSGTGFDEMTRKMVAAADAREARERSGRMPITAALAGACAFALLVLVAMSWRAGLAALAGVGVYYGLYNGLYFLVHGHHWSLSAFNTEAYLSAFFNLRMAEAATAGLLGVVMAALVYPLLRAEPKGPSAKGYLGGWLALGPATVLAIQATLGVQVAWFLWRWGAEVTWRLPDLRWGFKYDLDLIQVTALGAAALLAPVVSYIVGRYHPRVRRIGKGV